MDDSADVKALPFVNDLPDPFHQLFLNYIQQISCCYPLDPAIQEAVEMLKKLSEKS